MLLELFSRKSDFYPIRVFTTADTDGILAYGQGRPLTTCSLTTRTALTNTGIRHRKYEPGLTRREAFSPLVPKKTVSPAVSPPPWTTRRESNQDLPHRSTVSPRTNRGMTRGSVRLPRQPKRKQRASTATEPAGQDAIGRDRGEVAQ